MSTSTGPDTPLPRTPVDIPDHAPAPGTAPTSPPAPSATTADWTDQVTDLIVDSVDKVRARTTGPILEGSKGAVYAVVALMLLTPVLVMGTVGAVRLLNWALPGDVWVAYTVLGIIFVIVGVVLWSRRRAPAPR